MKNFYKKFRSYGFWVSLSGAIVILLNAFGRLFGFKIENQVVEDCIMSVAGVLVVLGIVTSSGDDDDNSKQDEDDLSEDNNANEQTEKDESENKNNE